MPIIHKRILVTARNNMSISTDNTNELDSYGVWVKHPSPENGTADGVPSDDLPDIQEPDILGDTDFSDMFKDDDCFSTEKEIPSADDTAMQDSPAQDVSPDGAEEDLPAESEEISLDDFMDGGFSDESVAAGNNGFEPGKNPAENSGGSETEEISLDDFFDGEDFDSGNQSKQEEEIPDEKPLEMDISFDSDADSIETVDNDNGESSSSENDAETTDYGDMAEIGDSDMAGGFDGIAVQPEPLNEDITTAAESAPVSTEDVDLSAFGIDADAEETPITQNVEEAKNKEKVVDYDLSVSTENTAAAPVVNEIKEEAVSAPSQQEEPAGKEEVMDNINSELLQQIVNDLSGLRNEINGLKNEIEELKAHGTASCGAQEEPVQVPEEQKDSGGFFGSDDSDDTIALSGDELDNIMNTADFTGEGTAQPESGEAEAVPEQGQAGAVPEEDTSETGAEEPASDQETEPENPQEIPAAEELPETDSAEEPETETAPEYPEDELNEVPTVENILKESGNLNEAMFGSVDSVEGLEPGDTAEDGQNDIYSFGDTDIEEPELEEPAIDGLETEVQDENIPDEISIPKTDDILVESSTDDFMNTLAENSGMEAPADAEFSDAEEPEEPEEFPEAGQNDDTAAETEETDSSDNIQDGSLTEEELPAAEQETENGQADDDFSFSDVDSFQEPEAADSDGTEPEGEIPSVDDIAPAEETAAESISVPETDVETEEKPADEETDVEEPFIQDFDAETSVSEDITLDDDHAEHDNFTDTRDEDAENTISESNLDYLAGDPGLADVPAEDEKAQTLNGTDLNSDLKRDIKSVLLYMDQLLENLPEEKIVEFAKSDEFATYKKLFQELGLS